MMFLEGGYENMADVSYLHMFPKRLQDIFLAPVGTGRNIYLFYHCVDIISGKHPLSQLVEGMHVHKKYTLQYCKLAIWLI